MPGRILFLQAMKSFSPNSCNLPMQVYQIIEFLGRPHNITTEGIFRKHGNLKKQQVIGQMCLLRFEFSDFSSFRH